MSPDEPVIKMRKCDLGRALSQPEPITLRRVQACVKEQLRRAEISSPVKRMMASKFLRVKKMPTGEDAAAHMARESCSA